jgi:hypothetical protein
VAFSGRVTVSLKTFSAIAIMLVALSGPVCAAGRSFEACRQLAWERGLYRPHYPNRYVMLAAQGQAKHPKGFMAQCMAGKF